jgi:hypothetical protein
VSENKSESIGENIVNEADDIYQKLLKDAGIKK